MATTFYILGTVERPESLIRHIRPPEPGKPTYSVWRTQLDDFEPNADVGQWIILGDTMLTKISPGQVAGIKRKLRKLRAEAPA